MKKITILFISALFYLRGLSQNIDSILSVPQTLELTVSTPQPRLGETFTLWLDIKYVQGHIFRSVIDKLQLVDNVGNRDDESMILNVSANKKGKTEIGPLQFTLNGTSYTTNKIQFEVIDPLPNVDKGLWFRKVAINDSIFCIIIEQRIPASSKTTKTSEKVTRYWTEPSTDNIVKFKKSYSIEGLEGGDGSTHTDFGSTRSVNGSKKQFMKVYSIIYFTIIEKSKRITITKNNFVNLPKDFKFQDIVVQ